MNTAILFYSSMSKNAALKLDFVYIEVVNLLFWNSKLTTFLYREAATRGVL